MKFANDSQRKALFARLNSFSSVNLSVGNRFALYYDKGRVRSTEYPQIDFKLESNMEPHVGMTDEEEALKVLGAVPEEYWAGVGVVQTKLKPYFRGKGGHYRPAASEESADEVLSWKLFQEGVMGDEAKEKISKLKELPEYKRAMEKVSERTPLVMISHFRGMGSETPRIVAHELGHHMDHEARELGRYDKAFVEPVADYAANIIVDGVVRKKYHPHARDFGIQQAEYAIALKEATTPSYEELEEYAGDIE